jgi:hypothetical protein|tara:strand:- start:1156 stop:1338 length:183 start_codon:yes stop_codon:yes gene_type:complete
MQNLWEKDRRKLFRDLYSLYIEEGYTPREAKKIAKEEADDRTGEHESFAMNIMNEEYKDD